MELEQENVVRASTGCGGWVDMAQGINVLF